MHIYKGTELNSSTIAVYNPKTHIMTEGTKPWVTNGSAVLYTAANDAIYVTSYDFTTGAVYLNIGTVSANGAPPVSTKVVPLNVGKCMPYGQGVQTVLREGLYYLFCGDSDLVTFRWFTYDGIKQSASSLPTNAWRSAKGFLPLGRAGKPATWAFMYDSSTLISITLTGPKAGEWRDAKYKFNITGPIPEPKPASAKRFSPIGSEIGSESGTNIFSRAVGGGMESHGGIEADGLGSGGLSTGALAGIVGSAVMVFGVAAPGQAILVDFRLPQSQSVSTRSRSQKMVDQLIVPRFECLDHRVTLCLGKVTSDLGLDNVAHPIRQVLHRGLPNQLRFAMTFILRLAADMLH
ncbi:hypothetical protein BGZ89_004412 [Linnemannia elongata]|nr:hypothetical protein BGZ89_004412 [Linnemannia elongata]